MKTKIYTVALFILSVFTSQAVAQTWQWARVEGGTAWDEGALICPDNKGGAFISGNYGASFQMSGQTIPFTTWSAHFLAKVDAAGQLVWTKPYSNHKSHCNALKSDKDGNLYMAGYFVGASITIDGVVLNTDATHGDKFFAKYDNSGTLLWAKNDFIAVQVDDISVDATGNFYFAGFFGTGGMKFGGVTYPCDNSISTTAYDAFFAKYDAAGNAAWAKVISGGATESVSSTGADAAGNIYVTGGFSSKNLQFAGSAVNIQKKDTVATEQDLFLAKYNSSGTLQWARSAGGFQTVSEYSPAIAVDDAGNVTLVSIFRLDTLTFDNTVTIYGKSWCSETMIVRYDKDGVVQWGNSSDGSQRIMSGSVAVNNGSVYILGQFGDYITSTTPTLTTNGYFDFYIARINPSGNWSWGVSAGGAGNDLPAKITADNLGNLYVSGLTQSPTITIGSQSFTGMGQADLFYGKLAASVGVDELVSKENSFIVYPNPMISSSLLLFNSHLSNAELTICDILGKEKRREIFSGMIMKLERGDLESGVYFVKVKEGERQWVQKVVIE